MKTYRKILYSSLRNCPDRETAFRAGVYFAAVMGVEWAAQVAKELWTANALHAEGTDTAGGYVVPEEFLDTVMVSRERYGTFRKFARVVPMTRETVNIPRRASGMTAYPAGEGATGTGESTPAFSSVGLHAKKWIAILRATNELNEDAITSFGDYIVGELGYAFAVAEDQAGFIGDGSSTYNGIQGLKNALAAGAVSTCAASATWAAITAAELSTFMSFALDYEGSRDPAFYCSKTFYHQVLERLALANGTDSGLQIVNGQPQYFFNGYPVRFSRAMPTATAASAICCYFGDLYLSACLGDRRQVTITRSDIASVGGQSMYERDEAGWKGTERIDIVINEVGTATAAGAIAALSTHS